MDSGVDVRTSLRKVGCALGAAERSAEKRFYSHLLTTRRQTPPRRDQPNSAHKHQEDQREQQEPTQHPSQNYERLKQIDQQTQKEQNLTLHTEHSQNVGSRKMENNLCPDGEDKQAPRADFDMQRKKIHGVLRAFEINMRRQDYERAADTLDACVRYLENTYSRQSGHDILVLLTSLARERKSDEDNTCSEPSLSNISDQLLAASMAAAGRNKLAIAHDFTRSRAPEAKDTLLAPYWPAQSVSGTLLSTTLAPAPSRLLENSAEGPAAPLRVNVQTVPKVRSRFPPAVDGKENWANPALLGPTLFSQEIQNKNKITHSISPDFAALEHATHESKGNGFAHNEDRQDNLLGALVSKAKLPKSLDIILSLPRLDTEYDGFAPDPLGSKIAESRQLRALDEVLRFHHSSEHTLAPKQIKPPTSSRRVDSEDLCEVEWLEKSDDVWLRAVNSKPEQGVLLGWEEEIPSSFIASQPQSDAEKALQYNSHAVLSSERGDRWFEYLIQKSGCFEQTRVVPTISEVSLRRDIMYALLGIPSSSFVLSADLMLHPCESRLTATTSRSIRSVLERIAKYGNLYLSLTGLCYSSTLLAGVEIADVIAERIDVHLLAHQRRVGMILRDEVFAPSESSLINLTYRIEGELAPTLQRLDFLFSNAAQLEDTICVLEHFYESTLNTGSSIRSVERDMLWSCLERVIHVLTSWAFSGSDALEHFEGSFFHHTGENSDGSLTHEQLLKAIADFSLPYALRVPRFFKSSLRGVYSVEVAHRAALCGSLLRLLRDMPDCAPFFALCTRKQDQAKFQASALRAGREYGTVVLQETMMAASSRKRHLIAEMEQLCSLKEAERLAYEKQQQLDAWNTLEASRAAAEAVNARFVAQSLEEQERLDAQRKARLEEFRVAAEEARAAKVRARLERQRLERLEQPVDITSTITEDQRREAEEYLLEQYRQLEQEQLAKGVELDARILQAKQELDTNLLALQQRPIGQLSTSIAIQQPPGGSSSADAIIYSNNSTTSYLSRPSIRIVGSPSYESQTLGNDIAAPSSVRIVGPSSGGDGHDMRAALGHEGFADSPNQSQQRSSVRIVEDSKHNMRSEDVGDEQQKPSIRVLPNSGGGEGSDARNAIIGMSTEGVSFQTPSGTLQTIEAVEEPLADAAAKPSEARVACLMDASTIKVQPDSVLQEESEFNTNAMSKNSVFSGSSLAVDKTETARSSGPSPETMLEFATDYQESPTVNAESGAESLKLSVDPIDLCRKRHSHEAKGIECTLPEDVDDPEVSLSTACIYSESEDNHSLSFHRPALHARIQQEPGGTSSLHLGSSDEIGSQEIQRHRVRVTQAPGGAQSSTNAVPERLHVRVQQEPGGSSSLNAGQWKNEAANSPRHKPKSSVKIQQSPGGASTFAFDAGPERDRSSVHVTQPAGGRSTIANLLEARGNSLPLKGTEARLMGIEAVHRIREAMIKATPLRYGDAMSSDLQECRQAPGGVASKTISDSLEDLGCDDSSCGALDAAIELALVEPLLQQCDLVESAFIAVVVRQSNLLEALSGIRSSILMAQGELFNGVVERLHDMRLRQVDFSAGKGRVLQEVLDSELDSLDLWSRNFAPHFKYKTSLTGDGKLPVEGDFSDFEFIEADYELAWPLSFIVRKSDSAAYPRIHRFLLRLKYAGALVRQVWKRLCETKGYRRLSIFTWLSIRWQQVRNLLSNLEDYLMTQLLSEHWTAMERSYRAPCSSFKHPNELQDVHHRFISSALRTCFLDDSAVSKVLYECISRTMQRTDTLAKYSLKLLDQITDTPGSASMHWEVPKELHAAWNEFQKTQTFLLRTVQSYSRNAISPDSAAQRILMHLNFNNFFLA